MNKLLMSLLLTLGVTTAVQAAGDAAAGQNKVAMCGACHGADGNSMMPNFPKLAGQGERYLLRYLRAFSYFRRLDLLADRGRRPLVQQDDASSRGLDR